MNSRQYGTCGCNVCSFSGCLVGSDYKGSRQPPWGDEASALYDCNDCYQENVIAEATHWGLAIHADSTGRGKRNKMLGSIALNNNNIGSIIDSRDSTKQIAKDNEVRDLVAIKNGGNGLYLRATINTQVRNATFFQNNKGLVADEPSVTSDLDSTFYATNALSFSNTQHGFQSINQFDWLINFSNSQGNGTNYSPSENVSDKSGNIINSLSTVLSGMGTGTDQCITYVPEGSNMKNAGDGGDIGANIIYRYENGTLTTIKLWDRSTGQFPCGATIAGLNDDANGSTLSTQACINVHKRLNVGVNGCPIP
jgi:hypothetical protein